MRDHADAQVRGGQVDVVRVVRKVLPLPALLALLALTDDEHVGGRFAAELRLHRLEQRLVRVGERVLAVHEDVDLEHVRGLEVRRVGRRQELGILEHELGPELGAGRLHLGLKHGEELLRELGVRQGPGLEGGDGRARDLEPCNVRRGRAREELPKHEHEREGLHRHGLDGLGRHAELLVERVQDLEDLLEDLKDS